MFGAFHLRYEVHELGEPWFQWVQLDVNRRRVTTDQPLRESLTLDGHEIETQSSLIRRDGGWSHTDSMPISVRYADRAPNRSI